MSINTGRVVAGGLAAGLVMNVVDGVSNGVLLASRWTADSNALNPTLMQKYAAISTVGWITFDFLCGIVLVWLYAAIRPRYGAGVGTAMRAGFVMWLVTHLAFASFVFMGLYSGALVALSALFGLAGALAGAYVGGMLYREEGEVAAVRRAAA